jgi:hypothetical protein
VTLAAFIACCSALICSSASLAQSAPNLFDKGAWSTEAIVGAMNGCLATGSASL